MKYNDLTTEQARKICKDAKRICTNCKLRRTRIDKEGKEHRLFCAFIIKALYEYDDNDYSQNEIEEVMNEEIEHYND